jgi:hypothetical protein
MTEASIKQKALTVANAFLGTDHATLALLSHQELYFALVYVVEQSEAYKQEVSDAAEAFIRGDVIWQTLGRFIIPKPKPDPLYECLEEALARNGDDLTEHTDRFRTALEARGLEIREKGQ